MNETAKVGKLTCSSLLLAILCSAASKSDGDARWLRLTFASLPSRQIIVEITSSDQYKQLKRWMSWIMKKKTTLNNPVKDAVWCTELRGKQVNKMSTSWRLEKQVCRGDRRRRSPPDSRMSTLGLWSASRSAVCPVVVSVRPLVLQAFFSSSDRKHCEETRNPPRSPPHRTLLIKGNRGHLPPRRCTPARLCGKLRTGEWCLRGGSKC